jgi:conjugative relaxase-like TrwC/TraI family protein
MLQINPVLNGKQAATFEYYAQESPGIWGGIGAETLDLYGEVYKEQFDLLASNKHPITGEKLTVRTKSKRRIGYDFCFDVPKSLSIYLAETNDSKLENIITQSALDTMYEMEQQIGTRVRKDNQWDNRITGNMVYAQFNHSTSRPVNGSVDPQRHIHFFVFNATEDKEEARWKACETEAIKRNANEYQRQYHGRLISRLRDNGYRVRITKDAFELYSITRDLIDKFSKRTKVIKESVQVNYALVEMRAAALVKYVGMTFEKALGKIKAMVTVETREKKSHKYVSHTEQQAQWRARMTPMELNSIWESKENRTTVDPVLTRKRPIMAERLPTQERTR